MFGSIRNNLFFARDFLFENAPISNIGSIGFNNFKSLRNRKIKARKIFDLAFYNFDNISMDVSPRRRVLFKPIMERFNDITKLGKEVRNIIKTP